MPKEQFFLPYNPGKDDPISKWKKECEDHKFPTVSYTEAAANLKNLRQSYEADRQYIRNFIASSTSTIINRWTKRLNREQRKSILQTGEIKIADTKALTKLYEQLDKEKAPRRMYLVGAIEPNAILLQWLDVE